MNEFLGTDKELRKKFICLGTRLTQVKKGKEEKMVNKLLRKYLRTYVVNETDFPLFHQLLLHNK